MFFRGVTKFQVRENRLYFGENSPEFFTFCSSEKNTFCISIFCINTPLDTKHLRDDLFKTEKQSPPMFYFEINRICDITCITSRQNFSAAYLSIGAIFFQNMQETKIKFAIFTKANLKKIGTFQQRFC